MSLYRPASGAQPTTRQAAAPRQEAARLNRPTSGAQPLMTPQELQVKRPCRSTDQRPEHSQQCCRQPHQDKRLHSSTNHRPGHSRQGLRLSGSRSGDNSRIHQPLQNQWDAHSQHANFKPVNQINSPITAHACTAPTTPQEEPPGRGQNHNLLCVPTPTSINLPHPSSIMSPPNNQSVSVYYRQKRQSRSTIIM